MDLAKHTLKDCLDFIEQEGYSIKNYVQGKKNNCVTGDSKTVFESLRTKRAPEHSETVRPFLNGGSHNYTLLYICDIDMNENKTVKHYNQYYECIVGKFDSIDELEIQLNIWDHGSSPLAIGIFYKNTNKTINSRFRLSIAEQYKIGNNINNFKTYLDKGDKLTDEYKSKNNICYNCEINKSIGSSCDFCLKYKICSKCSELKLFKYCMCGCKLKSCMNCIKTKFTKCCEHNDNYYYNKHKLPFVDCYKCGCRN